MIIRLVRTKQIDILVVCWILLTFIGNFLFLWQFINEYYDILFTIFCLVITIVGFVIATIADNLIQDSIEELDLELKLNEEARK